MFGLWLPKLMQLCGCLPAAHGRSQFWPQPGDNAAQPLHRRAYNFVTSHTILSLKLTPRVPPRPRRQPWLQPKRTWRPRATRSPA